METSLMICAVSLAPLLRALLFPEFEVVETNWTEVLIATVVLFDSNKLKMIDVVELGTVYMVAVLPPEAVAIEEPVVTLNVLAMTSRVQLRGLWRLPE